VIFTCNCSYKRNLRIGELFPKSGFGVNGAIDLPNEMIPQEYNKMIPRVRVRVRRSGVVVSALDSINEVESTKLIYVGPG